MSAGPMQVRVRPGSGRNCETLYRTAAGKIQVRQAAIEVVGKNPADAFDEMADELEGAAATYRSWAEFVRKVEDRR